MGDSIEKFLYTPIIVSINLILWGAVMIFLEKAQYNKNKNKVNSIEETTLKQNIVIGLMQVLALIPGTSRSGIVTIAGVVSGIKKEVALDYSFIIGLPLILGSFLYTFIFSDRNQPLLNWTNILSAIVAFLTGLVFMFLLQKIKNKNFLTFFWCI